MSETMEAKNARNARVQARYDDLMREGKHGHYETLFRVVREEVRLKTDWQPIETAPKDKDGPNVMLSNGVAVAQGWWVDEPPYIREHRDLEGNYIDQDESDGYTGWMDCDGGMLPEPTHWMPLPAPPVSATTAREGD